MKERIPMYVEFVPYKTCCNPVWDCIWWNVPFAAFKGKYCASARKDGSGQTLAPWQTLVCENTSVLSHVFHTAQRDAAFLLQTDHDMSSRERISGFKHAGKLLDGTTPRHLFFFFSSSTPPAHPATGNPLLRLYPAGLQSVPWEGQARSHRHRIRLHQSLCVPGEHMLGQNNWRTCMGFEQGREQALRGVWRNAIQAWQQIKTEWWLHQNSCTGNKAATKIWSKTSLFNDPSKQCSKHINQSRQDHKCQSIVRC